MTTTTNWNGPIATTEQIAELRAEVAALRAELVRMRLGFGDEVRTRRVAVVDGDYSTTIEPGHVTVEKRTAAGCRVDIIAASDGAEVIVAGHVAPDEDEQVSARLYAGDAGGIDPPTAFFAIGSPERGLQRWRPSTTWCYRSTTWPGRSSCSAVTEPRTVVRPTTSSGRERSAPSITTPRSAGGPSRGQSLSVTSGTARGRLVTQTRRRSGGGSDLLAATRLEAGDRR